MINVLGICSYPVEAAATRYRLVQFVEPLKHHNINLEIKPFLDSQGFSLLYSDKSFFSKISTLITPVLKRFSDTLRIKSYDLLYIQREAMLFGPAFFENLYKLVGNVPIILDLDDATYISYVSPTYGRIGSYLKFFNKTDKLIKKADLVICGNRFIAEYVATHDIRTEVVPTVVDTDKFHPIEKNNHPPVVGWIGTHSTFPFLQALFPVFENLAKRYDFKIKVIGAGREQIKIEGVEVENLEWDLATEIREFQSLDIGLYPLNADTKIPDQWIAGKSGFKAIQYMAVGIPYIVTPIGVCNEIGITGKTHFAADSLEKWGKYLSMLLKDSALRKEMGNSGRDFALNNYRLDLQTNKMAAAIQSVLKIR